MNLLNQERQNQSESCITIKVSRRTQGADIYHSNERSGFAFFSTDHGHISLFQKQFWLWNWRNVERIGPQRHEVGNDFVSLRYLIIHTDLVENNIVGDIKAPLLRCFLFTSRIKAGDVITTRQYMNYQSFSILQFSSLNRKFFRSIHIDFRDTSGEKRPFLSVGITRLVLIFKKASNIRF